MRKGIEAKPRTKLAMCNFVAGPRVIDEFDSSNRSGIISERRGDTRNGMRRTGDHDAHGNQRYIALAGNALHCVSTPNNIR